MAAKYPIIEWDPAADGPLDFPGGFDTKIMALGPAALPGKSIDVTAQQRASLNKLTEWAFNGYTNRMAAYQIFPGLNEIDPVALVGLLDKSGDVIPGTVVQNNGSSSTGTGNFANFFTYDTVTYNIRAAQSIDYDLTHTNFASPGAMFNYSATSNSPARANVYGGILSIENLNPIPGIGYINIDTIITDGTNSGYLTFTTRGAALGWQQLEVKLVGEGALKPGAWDILKQHATLVAEYNPLGEEVEDIMKKYQPRTSTNSIGQYICNQQEISDIFLDFWTTDTMENLRKSFIGQGSDCILSLNYFYGLRSIMGINNAQTKTESLKLGNLKYDKSYTTCDTEFWYFPVGAGSFVRTYGDYRDYEAVEYTIKIPFVGLVDVKAEDVVGRKVYVTFIINSTDGKALCVVTVDKDYKTATSSDVIFETSFQYGYPIPIQISASHSGLGAWASGLKNVLSSALGGGSANVSETYSVGSVDSDTGVLSDFNVSLIAKKKDVIEGHPGKEDSTTRSMGSFSDGEYIKGSVTNGGRLAVRGADHIIEAIAEGVYV